MSYHVTPSVMLRAEDVRLPAHLIFSDHFGKDYRPHFVLKARASEDAYYSDEDDGEDTAAEDRVRFEQFLVQVIATIKQHDSDFNTAKHVYEFEMIESGYKEMTLVSVSNQLLIEATISNEMVPSFAVYSARKNPLFKALSELLQTAKRPEKPQPHQINLIAMSGDDFYLNQVSIKNRQVDFSLENYNEDFGPVCERVLKSLKTEDSSGLVLFHGAVGTGKTSYMKYLLSQILEKKVIYVPPDMVANLASPSFVSFLIDRAQNSILLIEDAENVLQKRQGGQTQSVSNILNISDGILGDILQMQIVCTFNCPLADVDPALLRPGRLIAEYRFEKLHADRATTLLRKLYGPMVPQVEEPMSLAEIYNYQDLPSRSAD